MADGREPASLSHARAVRSRDCRDWTVVDALKECLRAIEAGEIVADMIFTALRERRVGAEGVPPAGGKTGYPFFVAGMERMDARGLLATHLLLTMDE